jgi:hypothetical protein
MVKHPRCYSLLAARSNTPCSVANMLTVISTPCLDMSISASDFYHLLAHTKKSDRGRLY